MDLNSSNGDTESPKQLGDTHNKPPMRKLYFINEIVEWHLTQYIWTGCTDVVLRDKIMANASELIRQIIRKQGLHNIYPGQEESAFGDLQQTGWCVKPDTIVFTENGVQELGDICGEGIGVGECGVKVFGPSGLHLASKYIRMPAIEIRNITTKFGYNLGATLDHPLPILVGNEIVKKQVKELRCGDLVGIQYNQQCFGNDNAIRFTPSNNNWSPGEFWTEELAYLIGLFIAEGSCSCGKVSIYNIEPEVVEFLENNTIGLNFINDVNSQKTTVSSVGLSQFLTYLGFREGHCKSQNKSIPKSLLKCSKNILSAALRGMYDGDGCSWHNNGVVGYTSTSAKLIQQLRVILLNYGIITRTTIDSRKTSVFPNKKNKPGYKVSNNKHTSYQLIIPTDCCDKFYDQIGFNVCRKQANKNNLSDKPFRLLPQKLTSILYEDLKRHKITKYKIRKRLGTKSCKLRNTISASRAMQLIDMLPVGECANTRNIIAGYDTMIWVPIDKIEAGFSDTVDIEVPSVGAFTAGGIYSFNCQLERILYKYRSRPHCRSCFNYERPSDSVLYQPKQSEYGIISIDDVIEMHHGVCPKCSSVLTDSPMVEPCQGTYGGTSTILYKGMSKVFNMWSQVARTVILAYIKKEGRDRKNSNTYAGYLSTKIKPNTDAIDRFLDEAMELCKYNEDHMAIIEAIKWLIANDDKPYDCMLGKLADRTGLPRPTITLFLRTIKLLSLEFTDSPLNRKNEMLKYDRKQSTVFDPEDD